MTARAEAQVRLSLVDRLTAPMRRVQARMAMMSRRLGFDRIGHAASNVTRHIGGLARSLGQVTGRLSAFVGILGLGSAGAVAGAFNLARSTAQLGSSISDTSARLGVGAEALQEYRYAAEMSGMASSNFDVALRRFIRRSSEAARGTGAAKDAFKELGISLHDSNGVLKDSDDLLMEVADAMTKVPKQADRLRLAFRMFDTDGAAMVNVFRDGAEGLSRYRREARQTGHVMSQEAADFGGVLVNNIERLTKRIQGLRNLLGVQLMPVMNDMVVSVTSWVDANRDLVRTTSSNGRNGSLTCCAT